MNWLYDSPYTIVGIGGAITVVMGLSWVKSGVKWLLFGALASLLLTGVLFAIERSTVTDYERIEQILVQGAKDVERNDLPAVLRMVHSKLGQVRQFTEQEMTRHQFKSLRVTRIRDIRVDADHQPPQITAEFVVAGTGTFENGAFPDLHVARYVELLFQKDGDEWRVVDFHHYDPQQSVMRRDRD